MLGAAALLAGTVQAANFSLVRNFGVLTNVTGFQPQSALVQDGSGALYGTTIISEGDLTGTVFKIQPNGTGFQVLMSFSPTNNNGSKPYGGLALSGTTLYGTTYNGGTGGSGTVFAINTDGTGFRVLTNFPAVNPMLVNSTGANPYGGLIVSGTTLYGTAQAGGTGANGTVFSLNTDGTGLQALKNFSPDPGGINSDGAAPDGTLVLSGNVLYGTTVNGGSSAMGTVFSLNTSTLAFSTLHAFTGGSDGAGPHSGLVLSGGWLFGTAAGGGAHGFGAVFGLTTSGSTFSNVYSFTGGSDGMTPYAGLVISGNTLYGTAYFGGNPGFGTVFSVNTNGSGFNALYQFDGAGSGGYPVASLLLSGGTLYGATGGATGVEDAAGGNGTLFSISTTGSGFSNIFTFTYSDAASPGAGLIVSGNTLYGTTFSGGAGGNGTVYKVNPDGSGYAILKNFSPFGSDPFSLLVTNADGANPQAGLVAAGGMLYGTTYYGGTGGAGTIFAVSTNGTGFTNLYNFTGAADGGNPQGTLVLSGNILYGAASQGGVNNNGALFSISTTGTGFTVLRPFSVTSAGTNSDGANPAAGLIMVGTKLFGTASMGGTAGNGTVFSYDTSTTTFANLHNFAGGVGGGTPTAPVTWYGGALYGTTTNGGTAGNGTVYMVASDGSTFATLKSFSALSQNVVTGLNTNSDGADPSGGLTLFGNMLYGTTYSGGTNGYGIVYAVNTNGAGVGFNTVYNFAGPDGANPQGSLLFSGNTLYGTTADGGNVADGTVFSLGLFSLPVQLSIQLVGGSAVLTWASPLFSLEVAPTVKGPFIPIAGAASPFTTNIGANGPQYFRLEANQ